LTSWRHGGFGDFNGRTRLVNFAEQRSGLRLVGAYGSSECFALMAKQVVSDPADVRSECGGAPVSSDILFRVVDVGSGSGVADGETGELQVKGFNVMTGYLNNPAATKEAFTADGWYRTGDLARLKGNKFAFLARISQSLRLSGYLVDPREIEEYLLLNKDVLDAAVVGARDQNGGEVAVAFVRTRTAEVTEESLKSLCRGRIAPYKVPACIVSMEELPFLVGPNGRKLDKRLLSELAKSLMASGEQRTRDSNSASLRTAKD
jgi:acyl-CoA synthetase (AMP-forming)/AMP-acid ligase II